MLTLKGISEASALRHLAKEAACPALVDREQLASSAAISQWQRRDAGGDGGRSRRSCAVLAGGPAWCWGLQPLQLP